MGIAELFEIRGEVTNKTKTVLSIMGVSLLIVIWFLITLIFPSPTFPGPLKVLGSYGELHFEDALIRNLFYSIKLNVFGYLEASIIAIPIGFIIGLFPCFKWLFSKQIEAMRFIPLTALTGLCVTWFGIYDFMKVQFLAIGIIVYLLPVVVQRVYEVDMVYEQTARTLGATKWQIIQSVFIPGVLQKVSDDIRVLVAISWTYIIVAELVNKSGGVGALAYTSARQSRIDKVFAILLVIIAVGFIQDKLFQILDKVLFPHKYV